MARRIPVVTEVAGLRNDILANLDSDLARLQDGETEVYDFTGECDQLRRLIADLRAGDIVELRRWGDGVRGGCAESWPAGAQVCTVDGDTSTPADYERLSQDG